MARRPSPTGKTRERARKKSVVGSQGSSALERPELLVGWELLGEGCAGVEPNLEQRGWHWAMNTRWQARAARHGPADGWTKGAPRYRAALPEWPSTRWLSRRNNHRLASRSAAGRRDPADSMNSRERQCRNACSAWEPRTAHPSLDEYSGRLAGQPFANACHAGFESTHYPPEQAATEFSPTRGGEEQAECETPGKEFRGGAQAVQHRSLTLRADRYLARR